MTLNADQQKRTVAARAVELVMPGMVVGLGTGSTAAIFVQLLGERVRGGLDITGIPTSEATAALARDHGIAMSSLDGSRPLDLTVDGADELGPGLTLIKGGDHRLSSPAHLARLSAAVAELCRRET